MAAHDAAQSQECGHRREHHEREEEVAEAHRRAQRDDGEDDECGDEKPGVVARAAFAEEVGCAAVAVERVAEH